MKILTIVDNRDDLQTWGNRLRGLDRNDHTTCPKCDYAVPLHPVSGLCGDCTPGIVRPAEVVNQ